MVCENVDYHNYINKSNSLWCCSGGEGGIRTHGTLARTTVFETVPIDHSGTSPRSAGEHTRQGAARNAIRPCEGPVYEARRICRAFPRNYIWLKRLLIYIWVGKPVGLYGNPVAPILLECAPRPWAAKE